MAALTGISYPLEVDSRTGNLKVVSDEDLIATHIISMVETEPGESPMRPGYGIPGALFESQQSWSAYAADVQRRLTREIPQATFAVNSRLEDGGAAYLEIYWQVQELSQEPIIVQLG
ncbi:hypothetical protein [Pseudanabaena sp. FACHB-2040]|uniref:hypothetical protein n=1 Tax=Pseudanabaena sp. FACHB-2040 TaxID=2692859 RepID=UPI001686BC34|nr:hypothetical protein [Pseudanabaena sp. FACHB-2040]MBD2256644.1 hypothetical protein [Pseudanabaena sp. FACHB-2040]